jgi:hypothetical protein
LDKLDLTVIGFDIEGWEVLIVVCVVDQLGILDDDCFVVVMVVFFEALDAVLQVSDESWRNFDLPAVVHETGSLKAGEDPDHLDEDVDKFEDLSLVDLLVDLVLPDVVGHIEEGDEFEFELLLLESELDLHSFNGVRFDHKIDVFLEVALHDLHLHFLVVALTLPLRSLLRLRLLLLLIDHYGRLEKLLSLNFLLELDVLDLCRRGWLFGQVLPLDAEGPNHLHVEVLSEDDIV